MPFKGAALDGDRGDGNHRVLRMRGPSAGWIFRYTSPRTCERREIGLGSARREDKDQAQAAARAARERALDFELMLMRDIDPLDEIETRKRAGREKAAAEKARHKQSAFALSQTSTLTSSRTDRRETSGRR